MLHKDIYHLVIYHVPFGESGAKIAIIFDKNKQNVKKRTIFVVFETCIYHKKAVILHRQIVNTENTSKYLKK